ncbi:hypothetical protein QE152_g5859 [Popillia japonica]|uniref:Uncharacterized protein n=1 Tax=Popillia japonica TaxID=7064 RepID=A0AAW1MLK5_POPJA
MSKDSLSTIVLALGIKDLLFLWRTIAQLGTSVTITINQILKPVLRPTFPKYWQHILLFTDVLQLQKESSTVSIKQPTTHYVCVKLSRLFPRHDSSNKAAIAIY